MYGRDESPDLSTLLGFPVHLVRRKPCADPSVKAAFPASSQDNEKVELRDSRRLALLGFELSVQRAMVFHMYYRNFELWIGDVSGVAELLGMRLRTAQRTMERAIEDLRDFSDEINDPRFWDKREHHYRSQPVQAARETPAGRYEIKGGRWKSELLGRANATLEKLDRQGYVPLPELEAAHAFYRAACDDLGLLRTTVLLLQCYEKEGDEEAAWTLFGEWQAIRNRLGHSVAFPEHSYPVLTPK